MDAMPVINLAETGKNIERMRKGKGMTVKDLQKVFGFETPQAIYKWQRGINLPTLDNLVVLAKLFDVTVDDIIAVDEIFVCKKSA